LRIVSRLRHGPAVACGLVGLAYLVTRLAELQDHRPAVALYTVAALASGYFGGPRIGVLATLLGALGLALQEGMSAGLFLFAPVGALAAYLGDQCLRALRTAGRFRDTLAGLRDAVVTADEAGRILALNTAAETLTGWTVADAVGKPLDTVFALDDAGAGKSAVERIRNMGGHALPPEEALLVGKDGVGRPVEFWAEPVRAGDGRHGDVLVLFRDVGARRSAEGELRQREDRFRALATHAAAGIVLLDRNGDCIFSNPAAQAVGGFNAVEALGAGWARTLDPEDRGVAEEWVAAARAGRAYAREFRFADGTGVRWVHLRAEAARSSDGQPLGHIGTLEDVTARKQLEAELTRRDQAEESRRAAAEAERRALEETSLRHEQQVTALRAAGQELGQRLLEKDRSLDELRLQLTETLRTADELRQVLEQERTLRTQNEARLHGEIADHQAARVAAEDARDELRRAAEEARQKHGRDRSARESAEAELRQQLAAVDGARQKTAALLEEARQAHARDRAAWEQTTQEHARHLEARDQTAAAWQQAVADLAAAKVAHEHERAARESAEAGWRERFAALEAAHGQANAQLAETRSQLERLQARNAEQQRLLEDVGERHAQHLRLFEELVEGHTRHVEQTTADRRRWQEEHTRAETARIRAAFLADASRVLAEAHGVDAALVAAARAAVPFLSEGCVLLGPAADGLAVEALAIADAGSVTVRDRREVSAVLAPGLIPGAGLLETVPATLAAAIADWTQLAVGRRITPTSAILLPVAVADGVQGVVLLFRGSPGPNFVLEDLTVAEDYVRRASSAIAAACRHHDLRKARADLADRLRQVDTVAMSPSGEATPDGYTLVERLTDRARPLLARIGEVAERLATRESRSREQPAADIEDATARLLTLVDSAGTAARIVRGGLAVYRQPVELGPLVERAVRAIYPTVRARRKYLTVALPLQPDRVIADPTRLEQALVAVLDNAARHAAPGGRVHLTTERQGDAIAIRVRDEGPGLADADLAEVAALSARAGRLWPRPGEGQGLGLALTRSLVELQGGRLEIHSPGTGVEVVVHLPAVARGGENPAAVTGMVREEEEANQAPDQAPAEVPSTVQ
jgi:PAS domain S-box-containing protein